MNDELMRDDERTARPRVFFSRQWPFGRGRSSDGPNIGVLLSGAIAATVVAATMSTLLQAPILISQKVTVPSAGSMVWLPVRNPENPSKLVSSASVNGTVEAITTNGSGSNTVTWMINGLTQGYYKVEIVYPKHSRNANCVLVQYKQTLDAGFTAFSHRLNQQNGDGDKVVSNRFIMSKTNVTPYLTSNTKSYIWVSNNSSGTPNSGSLSIRLTDGGCGSPVNPAGRIVADSIVLTHMGGVK